MNMKCSSCNTILDQLPGSAVLQRGSKGLHCPICGNLFQDFKPKGVPFDTQRGEFVIWDGHDGKFRFGAFEVTVQGATLSLDECLFTAVALFPGAEPDMFTPVRPERIHLIESCRLISQNTYAATYDVKTHDGYQREVHVDCVQVPNPPKESQLQDAALMIWPKFQVKDWSRYYMSFLSPAMPVGAGKISRVVEEPMGIRNIDDNYCQLNGVPRYVEISWQHAVDGRMYFAGFLPKLKQVDGNHISGVTIGFDFGTTNTAAAVRITGQGGDKEQVLEITDLTLDVIQGTLDKENNWFPRPAAPTRSIPSQLYFRLNLPESASLITTSLEPVRDYCIPFAQEDRKDIHYLGSFKWQKFLDGHLAEKVEVLQILYLKVAFEMFLAQVIFDFGVGSGAVKVLVATFPLAFGAEQQEMHRKVFGAISAYVKEFSPFDITPEPDLNESYAGENGAGRFVDIDEILVVDVGGGTTDICIFDPNAGDAGMVLIQDSLEYGGEEVILAITRKEKPLMPFSLAALRNHIRTLGPEFLIDSSHFTDLHQQRQVLRLLKLFRRGVIEICTRFIAARLPHNSSETPPKRFGLLMLGNGWRLLQPTAQLDLQKEVENAIMERLTEYKSLGIISAIPQGLKANFPDDPKGVVSLGAALVHKIGNPPAPNPISYMLLDMVLEINRTAKELPWTQLLPMPMDGMASALKIKDPRQFEFDMEGNVKAPRQASTDRQQLLEKFDFLPTCAPKWEKTHKILHSPISLYLKQYAAFFSRSMGKEQNA